MILIRYILYICSTNHHFILACKTTINGTMNATFESPDPEMPCVSSWTYPINGMTYSGCANPDNDPGGDWCPTMVNQDGNYEPKSRRWGYCNDKCPKDHQGNEILV